MSALAHVHPAVYVEDLAGDVAGFVACQKGDGGGNVAVGSEAAQRDQRFHFIFQFLRERSVIGVSIKPGAMAFTVMLREATSTAMARVRPIRPAFEAT